MPELDFKGKEFVRNHHLTVPYRPLVPVPEKGIGAPDLDGNLIIHGDNLEALKALLPRYAGKVDCIFIDPPYNTGNEGWCYNDNVNSPVLKSWFSENPVGLDDGLRHDKWCCMMWPRLKLMRELLSEIGSLWITLDDNEIHRARNMLDEIFGDSNFVTSIAWQKIFSTKNTARQFSESYDHLIVYAVGGATWTPNRLERGEVQDARYSNPDDDPRGPWTSGDCAARNPYSEGRYAVTSPSGRVISGPPPGTYWRFSKAKFLALDDDGRIWWGKDGNNVPRLKRFASEVMSGLVPGTWWTHHEVGHTQEAKQELNEILAIGPDDEAFISPKPTRLISRVLALATDAESVVLDSFAGSGTTAHAVLKLNALDGGNRRFILVEYEDYADTLTAERVRRVINGYPFQGVQRETLFERKLTWTEVKKGDRLRQEAENTKALYEASFDRVKITVDDGVLKVIGERDVSETTAGLGGEFSYCELGRPLSLEALFRGDELPEREALGEYLLYVAGTGSDRESPVALPEALRQHFLAKQGGIYYWFLYRADRDWLRGGDSALTLDLARAIAAVDPGAGHRVFAPQKFVGNRTLRADNLRIEFAPIPFALFRRGAE